MERIQKAGIVVGLVMGMMVYQVSKGAIASGQAPTETQAVEQPDEEQNPLAPQAAQVPISSIKSGQAPTEVQAQPEQEKATSASPAVQAPTSSIKSGQAPTETQAQPDQKQTPSAPQNAALAEQPAQEPAAEQTAAEQAPQEAEQPSPEPAAEAAPQPQENMAAPSHLSETNASLPGVASEQSETRSRGQADATAATPVQPEAEQPPAQPVEEQASVQPAQPVEASRHLSETNAGQAAQATPVKPAAPQQQPEEEVIGLDTVDLENPQGNWLFKRVWWERAEAKYEKISETVTKITEAKTAFLAKRSDLEKKILDPFYVQIGFSQGELQAVLADLNEQVKKTEKNEKLTHEEKEDEQQLVDNVQQEAESIKQLQEELDKVIKDDETLDGAVMQLADLINRMRGYEQQAWHDFKEIARVLDDKKARELFYRVDNAWRNVQEIQMYIEQGFSTSFDRISENIRQSVQRIASSIASLEEKGIDLKKRARELNGEIEEQTTKPQEPGLITRWVIHPVKSVLTAITSILQMIWHYTVYAVQWPFKKIMGSSSELQQAEEPAEHREEAEAEQAVPSESSEPAQEEHAAAFNARGAEQAQSEDTLPDTMEEFDMHELALNGSGSHDSFDSTLNPDESIPVMA